MNLHPADLRLESGLLTKEKVSGFEPGGGIPTTCRTTAWEFMGQSVPRNYGLLVFAIPLPTRDQFNPTSESIYGLCADYTGGSGETEEPETTADPTAGGSGETEEPGESSAPAEESHAAEAEEGSGEPEEPLPNRPFWAPYD
eukprot:s87_g9.t1